jgi:hypothetical protein
MRLAILAVAGLALAACGQRAGGYPPGYELEFMRACEAQSAVPGLCQCTWDKIEAEVPADEFAALDQLPGQQREEHPLMQQIAGYTYACATQLSGEQSPAP